MLIVKDNIIANKAFDFALNIISLYRVMIQNREYIISRQIIRSATSIGANIEEAIAGQSKKDFIAKMCLASKEAHETRYWLKILECSQLINYKYNPLLNDINEIIQILTKIVKTSQQNLSN